ncbi:MAG TPA: signal peptidase II [Vicinamibacteria bacterium]|nr:signal peptidase II [Vicinamibacteria bacterium]
MSARSRLPEALLLGFVVVLDQVTKEALKRSLELHEYRPLVDGFLSLSHVRNRGAAFGLLADAGLPYQGPILAVVSLLALAAIGAYAWRLPEEARLPRLALAFILGGAIGNLIDRVRFGYVVDFIHVYWNQHSWPDFNVADSAISTGVALLILDMLRPARRPEPQPHPDVT